MNTQDDLTPVVPIISVHNYRRAERLREVQEREMAVIEKLISEGWEIEAREGGSWCARKAGVQS